MTATQHTFLLYHLSYKENYLDGEKPDSYIGDRTLTPDGKLSGKNELNTFHILKESFLSSTTRGFFQAKLMRPCR